MNKLKLIVLFIFIVPIYANAYHHLSPYSYCAGNPVNNVDPSGKDIVVLNYGIFTDQHLAMLIQDENGKWQYYSVNGNNVYISGSFSGGRPFNDVAVGSWDSPQEFFDSDYNVEGGKEGKTDENINYYGFPEGYQIKTTAAQDEIMRDEFKKESETEYDFFNNNCAHAVQNVMIKAGVLVSEPEYKTTTVPVTTDFGTVDMIIHVDVINNTTKVPSWAYKSIQKMNPGGVTYYKNK